MVSNINIKTFYNVFVVIFTQHIPRSIIYMFYFCYMDIEIGNIIKQELEKTGWSISQFAQQIRRDRTIVYHIFKRKAFDTDLLYDISMALNIDLFKYYSCLLEKNNDIIRIRKSQEPPQKQTAARKILVEMELTEEEYQNLLKNKL